MPAIGTGVSTAKGGQSWSSYWAQRKPSNLMAETVSETEIDIIYDDAVQSADGLKVYVSTDGGLNYSLNRTLPYGQGSARLTGLTATTTYTIKLVAYKGTNESDPITATATTVNSALIAGWSFNPNVRSWGNHSLADYPFGVGFNSAQYFNGKTYVVYTGQNNDPYIIAYNHSTFTWSNPVRIGANPLVYTDQGHGEPSLLITTNGSIHVFWGSHNTACKYSRSTNPEDITAWTAMADLPSSTYNHALQFSTGRIYVFYRNSLGSPSCYWGYVTSDDNGDNWAAETIVSHDFAYGQFKKGMGDTIHAAYCGKNTTAMSRYNLYYMKFDGTKWRDAAGTELTTPIDYATHAAQLIVRNTDSKWIPLAMPLFDASDNPYIAYSESTTEFEISTYNHKIAKYSGGAWNNISLGVAGNRWHDYFVCAEIKAGGVIDAYVVTGGVADSVGGNIELWRSSNAGSTWAKIKIIREGQMSFPIMVKDYVAEGKLIFTNYVGELLRYCNGLYMWGDSGFVKGKSVSALDVPSKRFRNRMTVSGATFTDGAVGKLLTFAGNPQYAGIPDSDELSFTGGSPDKPFSLAFRLKVTNTANTQWLFIKGLNTTKHEWRSLILSNKLYFAVYNAGGTIYRGRYAPYTSNAENHIIITYDGSGTCAGVAIYVNNVQADTTDYTAGTYAGMTADSAGVYVGANSSLSTNFLVGALGEPRIFNKVLSEAERLLVYNGDVRW